MQPGTPEHKAQYCQDLIKSYQENIWTEELKTLEFEELLADLRKETAEIRLKIDNKEFKIANEGKKALAKNESNIEATQAAIEKKKADRQHWLDRIEFVKRYAEQSPQE